MRNKIKLLSFAALFVFVFAGMSEGVVRVRRMGDPKTAFYSPDLKSKEDLRKMLTVRREDIRLVVGQVGWMGNVDDLIRALDTGEVGDTTLNTGTTLPFMAARKNGRPRVMRNVLYEGPPLEAYYIDFESNGAGWRFITPKICSNFWLEERAIEKPPPPPPPPPPAPEPPPPPAPEVVPPPPPPPPPEVEVERHRLFFLAGFVGKERRTELEGLSLDADCVTLLGIKGGVLPRLGENAELELSVGGKFPIGEDDDDTEFDDLDGDAGDDGNDNTIFADVAIHGLFGSGGFVGGGVSFWDLTNSELRTVALLVQFGFGAENLQFTVEARAPFEDFDDLGNNYMVWGGIRIKL